MLPLIALIVVSLIAVGAVAGLIIVCIRLGDANRRLGNQVIANSDHQLRRIAIEEGADAYREAQRAVSGRGSISPGYDPPEELVEVPSRE